MKHRSVAAVMTPADRVASVRADTGYKEIARLLADRGISAVPVLDDASHVVGVVSEADLLAKESRLDDGEEDHIPFFVGSHTRMIKAKAAASSAAELMTSPAVTVGPEEDVVRAARLMDSRRVKRLPVVDAQGRLLGVVSRRDILRLFVRPDEEIRTEIREEILLKILWFDPDRLEITVADGVVRLAGEVETRSMAGLVASLVRRTDGVVAVVDDLTFAVDDTEEPPPQGPIYGIFDRRHR